jgi:ABC-2 type transport system permease protein
MNQIIQIARRELAGFFDSLMGYVLIIMFLGFSGFFTWIYGDDIFFIGEANLNIFFKVAYWSLFFFIPSLTMRSLTGELRGGTLELLLTKPISYWQLILGKFTSTFILISMALAPSLIYYISLWSIGSVDHPAIILGYIGLLMMSMSYIALGIFCSSLSDSPIIALLSTLFIGIFFHQIFETIASASLGITGSIFSALSMFTHFESISRGIFDLQDFIFFLSMIIFGLYASKEILVSRNLNA